MTAFRYSPEDLSNALETLQKGGVILYPTDTVWGLGCDATNPEAVSKIFEIKGREDSKALISILDSSAKLQGLMVEVPEIAYDLIDLSTTPLTIVYPNVTGVAPNLLAQDHSAGIRVCHEPFCKALCERFKRPIVSTSANKSGEPTPSHFAQIPPEIISAVDYTVEYRRDDTTPHTASRIIKLEVDGTFVIIR